MINFPGFDEFEKMRRAAEGAIGMQHHLLHIGVLPDILPRIGALHELLDAHKYAETLRQMEEISGARVFERFAQDTTAIVAALNPSILARQQFQRSIQDAVMGTDFRQSLRDAQPYTETLKRMEGFNEAWTLDGISQSSAAIVEALNPVIIARQQFERSIQNALIGIDFRQCDELYRAFQFLERIRTNERHTQVVKILARGGWTGLERQLTEYSFDKIIKLRQSKKPSLIDDYICSQFSKSGYKKLNSVSRYYSRVSFLKKRRSKIRQALLHHKDGAYAASISILFPLIDGLAAHIASKILGLSKSRMRVKKVAEEHHTSEGSIWSECIKQVVCDIMYEDVDFDNPPRRRIINRHLTLHGHSNQCDTEANSLRVILLLNTFAHIAVANHIQ